MEMDATKDFDDLTWDDVVIEQDALKAIREFSVNELEHKDLHAVCSWLKIKGVKNTSKESMLEKIVSIYKLKERYGRHKDDAELVLTPTRKVPQCPYRLLNILFSDMFSEELAQLGNVANQFELDAGKASNNQLFGKSSKKPLQATLNYTTTCILRMRSLVIFIILTSRG